jgi:hypothetical protein
MVWLSTVLRVQRRGRREEDAEDAEKREKRKAWDKEGLSGIISGSAFIWVLSFVSSLCSPCSLC